MGADDVVAIAEAVYAVPPGEFVAERKRRAAAARADGDRDLAARVSALPKASASAALVNRLVHDAEDDLLRVLRLGAELREAQDAGDASRLRALAADRRRLLDEVATAAADPAEEDGRRPGAAVLDEVQQTLQAAMASDAAAAAVRSGRLVRALSADGLEAADLRGAVAPEGTLPEAAPLPPADAPAGHDEEADEADRRRRAEVEQRAAAAREAAAEAEEAADAAQAESDERSRAADEARERVESLRSRLRSAEAEAAEAEGAADAAGKTAATSAEAADRARAEADAAEESLAQQPTAR